MMVGKHFGWRSCLGIALAWLPIFVGASEAWAAKKNVVLFVADDWGPDAGCYGINTIQTPAVDRLAAEGVRFTHAFCTTASCSASRSVILTGMYNHANAQFGHEHSYHHFRTYETLKTLPVLMSEAGYRTARVGKFHVGPEAVYQFDQALKGNARNGVEMAENCRKFVTADDGKPFFLYFCTADPHRGGGAVEELPEKPNRFGNGPKYAGVNEVTYPPSQVMVPAFLPDTPVCRAELAQYYQSVTRVDQGLAKLVGLLKEAGVYDDTLIIVTSDHGIAFPGGKTTTYEGGLRIPMIVRNPYLEQRGQTCDALVNLADLTPTILDFAGATPAKSTVQGRSFLPVLGQAKTTGWDETFASHTFHEITMYYPMRVVRNRDYKLIWNIAYQLPYPFASDLWEAPTWQDIYRQGKDALYGKRSVERYIHRPKFELYDLQKDPDETKNLADDPAYAETLKALQDRLKAFQKQTKDPWLLKWTYE